MKRKTTIALLLVAFTHIAFAVDSLGEFADSLLNPVSGMANVIKFICVVVGGGMVMASLVKLKEYIQQTTDTGLLSIITLFIIGLAMIALIFLPMF